MANSIDPDEMAHYEASHLDLCCLQKPIIIAYGSKRVKTKRGHVVSIAMCSIYSLIRLLGALGNL